MHIKIFHITTDFLLDMNNAKHLIDISDLSDEEKKIISDLANALRNRTVT